MLASTNDQLLVDGVDFVFVNLEKVVIKRHRHIKPARFGVDEPADVMRC